MKNNDQIKTINIFIIHEVVRNHRFLVDFNEKGIKIAI